jgi:gas vesicle protein
MRIYHLIAIAGLSVVLATPASAQTIKKIGDDIHHTLKKAGNETKAGAKDVGDAAHNTLKKAGNGTKTTLGNATGIHKIGGTVGAAAGEVSRTGKSVGRSAKHSVKKNSNAAHKSLKKEGREAKAQIKP